MKSITPALTGTPDPMAAHNVAMTTLTGGMTNKLYIEKL